MTLSKKTHNAARRLLPALAILLIGGLTACTNRSTVNILISNTSTSVLTQPEVEVPLSEVRTWLDLAQGDTLLLLNERNEPVPYVLNNSGTAIRFTVPIIQKDSQKQFSLNTSHPRLTDNLFSFRRRSIEVKVP